MLFGYSKCTLSFMDERMGLMIQVLNRDIIVDFKYVVVFFKIKNTKWFSVMIYFSINEKGINHYDEVFIYDRGNQIQMIDKESIIQYFILVKEYCLITNILIIFNNF